VGGDPDEELAGRGGAGGVEREIVLPQVDAVGAHGKGDVEAIVNDEKGTGGAHDRLQGGSDGDELADGGAFHAELEDGGAAGDELASEGDGALAHLGCGCGPEVDDAVEASDARDARFVPHCGSSTS
jgi:hypothetical protein